MLSAARKLTFWQDVPLLFLAWLVPSTLLLAFAAPQNISKLSFSTSDLAGLSQVHDLASVPAPAETFAHFVWPLVLLGALILGLASCSSHVMDKRGTLISLAYCTLSLSILPQFTPGSTTEGSVHIVLLIGLLALCFGARYSAKLAAAAGLCAAALLVIGPQGMAFTYISVAWMAISWALRSSEQGDAATIELTYFSYSFVSGIIFFALLGDLQLRTIPTDCGPLSLTYLAPAVLVGAGLTYLAGSTQEFRTARQRLCSVGLLFVAGFCGLLAINPTCVISPVTDLFAATAPTTAFAGAGGGLLALIIREPLSAYALMTTPALGLVAATIATARPGRHQIEWALLLASLFAAVLLMMWDVDLSVLAHTLAIMPCAWMTLKVGHRCRGRRPTLLAGLAFIAAWLAGMNLTHTLIASQIIAVSEGERSQTLRIPANTQCAEVMPATAGGAENIILSKGKPPCR